MGNFVPHLSHHTEPLRAMLKQEAVFAWDEMANSSFQKIKDLIAKSATKPLRYYDQRKPVTVQADASQRGLGACLLQDGQRIAYASKSLTDTETRYANIERELLAIVFACQRFNTYVLGRPFTVESDHKPLEMIHQKSLASAPPPTPANAPAVTAIRCDHQIQTREGNAACRCTEQVPLTSFWGNQTGYESQLHCLQQDLDSQTQGYHQGRPYSWHGLPAHSAGVATSKEAYSANGQGRTGTSETSSPQTRGLLLIGPRIVIPSCLHEEYLQRLHQGHLSATKVQQNARQHLYWPGLDADIADYTRRCQECIRRSQPPKEPLQAHEVPQEPWERIAMDYFYMNGRLYILICDYFSKFPFMFQVKTTSFANLKDHLEELFSVEGIPVEIMSDNGPPL